MKPFWTVSWFFQLLMAHHWLHWRYCFSSLLLYVTAISISCNAKYISHSKQSSSPAFCCSEFQISSFLYTLETTTHQLNFSCLKQILKKICDHPYLLTKRAAEDVLEGMDSMLSPEDRSLAENLALHLADVSERGAFHEKHDNISCKISFILSLLVRDGRHN